MRLLLLTLALLPGCPATAPTGACAELSPGDCAHRDDCAVIDGRYVDVITSDTAGAAECVQFGDRKDLGCQDAGTDCAMVETWAADPADAHCYLFSNACVPAGFVACEPDPDGLPEC